MGLDRVHQVLDSLNIAPFGYALISVAGTNGKGSSVGLLEAILTEMGYRVGAYTSPHLVHYAERIRVQRTPVSGSELCRAFEMIEAARGNVALTYFEFGTLAALLIFSVHNLDVAVMEVGMGGRLDAVNAVDADAALITSIGVDHVNWLGQDRAQIAVEKAGIMRPARPVVVVDPDPPPSLIKHAHDIDARVYFLHQQFGYQVRDDVWDWWGPQQRQYRGLPRPALVGPWQVRNAAGVLMVLESLSHRLSVNDEAIHHGMRSVSVPGRFQVIPGAPEVILDVAHNLEAVSALRDQLRRMERRDRTIAVCAMLRDKPAQQIATLLAEDIDHWFVAPIDDPRGATGEDMRDAILRGIGAGADHRVVPCGSVTAALEEAHALAGPHDRLVVFGSFHTVGDIIAYLKLPSI
jgi:dihydrofolate synthase/folylpolyglutamate synthase